MRPSSRPFGVRPSHFVDQAGVDHRFDAAFDPLVQLLAAAAQDEHAAFVGRPAFFELQLLMADRLAGGAIDFECADQPARVVRMDVRCGHRIDLRKSIVERLLADVLQFLLDFVAQLPIGRRAVEQAAQQALEIQRRAADEQRLRGRGRECRRRPRPPHRRIGRR